MIRVSSASPNFGGSLGRLPDSGLGGPGPVYVEGCGESPCGAWDYIWMRDSCQEYLRCADPGNDLLKITEEGLVVGGAEILGETTGHAGTNLVGGIAEGVGGAIEERSSITTKLILAAMVVGAFVLVIKR